MLVGKLAVVQPQKKKYVKYVAGSRCTQWDLQKEHFSKVVYSMSMFQWGPAAQQTFLNALIVHITDMLINSEDVDLALVMCQRYILLRLLNRSCNW